MPTVYTFNKIKNCNNNNNGDNNNNGGPLIFVFGWLGATWRHFEKYLHWYNFCNLETISTIPPITSSYVFNNFYFSL
jgi:hypothetical protein